MNPSSFGYQAAICRLVRRNNHNKKNWNVPTLNKRRITLSVTNTTTKVDYHPFLFQQQQRHTSSSSSRRNTKFANDTSHNKTLSSLPSTIINDDNIDNDKDEHYYQHNNHSSSNNNNRTSNSSIYPANSTSLSTPLSSSSSSSSSLPSSSCYNCCSIAQLNSSDNLPPPLPEPKYSVHKRVLPSQLWALSSPMGRKLLMESLAAGTAESYWCLMEQFINQSDPAFCGVTTLLMVLNAMDLDPNVRWRGGWRYFGNEDVLLNRCCINAERIRRQGITMEQFRSLARCQGMNVTLKRPPTTPIIPTPTPPLTTIKQQQTETETEKETETDNNNHNGYNTDNHHYTIDVFRKDVVQILTTTTDHNHHIQNNSNGILVVSFSREGLGQTGDGHFSPVAAFHEPTDRVLVLDVARFKYSPYWVKLSDLYSAMEPIDPVSEKPRGWYLCYPPPIRTQQQKLKQKYLLSSLQQQEEEEGEGEEEALPITRISPSVIMEDRRPVNIVPQATDHKDICPVGKIKVEFCDAAKES